MRLTILSILLTILTASSACSTDSAAPLQSDDGLAASEQETRSLLAYECDMTLQITRFHCPAASEVPNTPAARAALCIDQVSLIDPACFNALGDWYSCLQESRYICTPGSARQLDCDHQYWSVVSCIYATGEQP